MTPQSTPGEDSLLAAIADTADGRALDRDFEHLRLIAANRDLGATWAVIGRAQGKPAKAAKRDAKRLKQRTRRSWYLQQNQEARP